MPDPSATGRDAPASPVRPSQVQDLDDPQVWEMVKFNHNPEEHWFVNGELSRVACRACGHAWPCPSVQRLREHAERF